MQPYSWIFVDGATQQTFRIRSQDPAWETSEEGVWREAKVRFRVTADDGSHFDYLLQISRDVLASQEIADPQALGRFLASKGVEIVEGMIHRGIRQNQQVVLESDGVSLI